MKIRCRNQPYSYFRSGKSLSDAVVRPDVFIEIKPVLEFGNADIDRQPKPMVDPTWSASGTLLSIQKLH
jgi:hypothetical protein